MMNRKPSGHLVALFGCCAAILAMAIGHMKCVYAESPVGLTAVQPTNRVGTEANQESTVARSDLEILKQYVEHECVPVKRGVAFRIRLDQLSSAAVPIPVPAEISVQMQKTKFIRGTLSEGACSIELLDEKDTRIADLKTAEKGLLGFVWTNPSLTDDDFFRGLCGYFPLCFRGNELRLWPLRVVIACLSPVSLNSPVYYSFAERSGITVGSSSPSKKEYLLNTKADCNPECVIVLDCADGFWACSSVTSRESSGVNACPDGCYPALGRYGKHTGRKLSLDEGYWVFDHAQGRLLNGVEFQVTIVETKLIS